MIENVKSPFEELRWQPPSHWGHITTIDMHTGGEPLRVIVSGLPVIEGATVLEKRSYFREHFDFLRTGTMWEPRGHADMYGAVLSKSQSADFDVFFLHNEGYSTMCGHAIIALTTLVIETGMVECVSHDSDCIETQLTFNVPAGLIRARAFVRDGKVEDVTFRNVPSFLYRKDCSVEVPGIGNVQFDVAFGGAFYAIVDAYELGLSLTADCFNLLIDYGRRIKLAAMGAFTFDHPLEKELSFLYGTIFTAPAVEVGNHSRNVCIFASGELDRSPTGSGVSARAALQFAKGELQLNEKIRIESILGSTMTVRVAERTTFGSYEAVIPEVGGTAFIVGRNELYFDPHDPYRNGFLFR